jgi:hypothetical protein
MSPQTWMNLKEALRITAVGMGGLFVFMALFYALLEAVQRIFPGKEDEGGPSV